MGENRFTDEQTVFALRQAESATSVADTKRPLKEYAGFSSLL